MTKNLPYSTPILTAGEAFYIFPEICLSWPSGPTAAELFPKARFILLHELDIFFHIEPKSSVQGPVTHQDTCGHHYSMAAPLTRHPLATVSDQKEKTVFATIFHPPWENLNLWINEPDDISRLVLLVYHQLIDEILDFLRLLVRSWLLRTR